MPAVSAWPFAALRRLCLNDQVLFSDESLFSLLLLVGVQLEHLELENTGVTKRGIMAIGTCCRNLVGLNIVRLEFDDTALCAVANGCPLLEELAACFAFDVTAVTVRALIRQCRRLRHLNLRSCAAPDGLPAPITASAPPVAHPALSRLLVDLPCLVHLDVSSTLIDLACVAAQLTRPLPLESLVLTSTGTTDAGMLALAPFLPGLRRLDVFECPAVSDVGLRAIVTHCPHLMMLTVGSGTRMTAATLEALAAAPCARVFEELHCCVEVDASLEFPYPPSQCSAFVFVLLLFRLFC